jgi:retron-type reverse transcriptase
VDRDLEQFVDRGNHDPLMSVVKQWGADRRVLQLIARHLTAGALTDEGLEATVEGTPPGGALVALASHSAAGRSGPGVGASGAPVRALCG